VSEVGGSDRIGFISSDYDSKYVTIWCQQSRSHKLQTTGVRSCIDWIGLIGLLDLRLHRVLISPHYGDSTDDGSSGGQNGRQYKTNQEDLLARMEAKKRGRLKGKPFVRK
jgi:hypothetical protein